MQRLDDVHAIYISRYFFPQSESKCSVNVRIKYDNMSLKLATANWKIKCVYDGATKEKCHIITNRKKYKI